MVESHRLRARGSAGRPAGPRPHDRYDTPSSPSFDTHSLGVYFAVATPYLTVPGGTSTVEINTAGHHTLAAYFAR
jgi:hypothetical protein